MEWTLTVLLINHNFSQIVEGEVIEARDGVEISRSAISDFYEARGKTLVSFWGSEIGTSAGYSVPQLAIGRVP